MVLRLTEYAKFNGAVHFFCFRPETPFLGKFDRKNQNFQFKLKCVTWTNSNMKNSMALFTFSVLDRKHPFWRNLVQKVKIVSLSWNLLLRLIRTWRMQCHSDFFDIAFLFCWSECVHGLFFWHFLKKITENVNKLISHKLIFCLKHLVGKSWLYVSCNMNQTQIDKFRLNF